MSDERARRWRGARVIIRPSYVAATVVDADADGFALAWRGRDGKKRHLRLDWSSLDAGRAMVLFDIDEQMSEKITVPDVATG